MLILLSTLTFLLRKVILVLVMQRTSKLSTEIKEKKEKVKSLVV